MALVRFGHALQVLHNVLWSPNAKKHLKLLIYVKNALNYENLTKNPCFIAFDPFALHVELGVPYRAAATNETQNAPSD